MDFVKFNDFKIPTILAITPAEQEKGLMYETNLPSSMAFIYSEPKRNTFWMSNTPKPLDIIFCLNNKVISIYKGEPFSLKLIGGDVSDLVIEMPEGQSKKIGIDVGSGIEMEYSPKSLARISLSSFHLKY